ncbi:hypothetical protein FOZ60_009124 [Perkinsus olseni]|uniref:Uncharacterized protein n=1 Tax=Perkinsus olseni TaxID=32597 RepID=A0A7J6NHT2_PEROL|nr:hypothetical protein FOZ60_009124 [Perkinsus olseni]
MSSFGGGGVRRDEERLRRRSMPYRPLAVLADPEFLGKRRYREMNLLWRDIVRRTRQEKIRRAEGDESGCDEQTTDDLLERVLRTGSSMDVLDSLPHMGLPSDPSPPPAAPTSSEGSIDGRSLRPGDISDPCFEAPTRPFTPQPRRVLSPVRLQKRPRVACRTSASRAAERVQRRRSSLGSPGLSLGLRDYCDIDSDGEEASNSAGVSVGEYLFKRRKLYFGAGGATFGLTLSLPCHGGTSIRSKELGSNQLLRFTSIDLWSTSRSPPRHDHLQTFSRPNHVQQRRTPTYPQY